MIYRLRNNSYVASETNKKKETNPCRDLIYCVMAPSFCLVAITSILLLIHAEVVKSNHYLWWTCTTECRRCIRRTTPMEQWISEYYSGLFSSAPPVAFYDSVGNPEVHSAANPSHPVDSSEKEVGNSGNHSNPWSNNPGNPHGYGCCETEFGHWAPNRTEYHSKRYTVVHLRNMYQFIPVGKCKTASACATGQCVQILRVHWILVYDDRRKAVGPPVTFVPIKIPSHCECLNIGRSRP